jgi:glutaredoxin 3
MAEVTIYTTPVCPYCNRAKDLLKRKGRADWKDIDVSDDDARMKMIELAGGRRTVPQIFIGDLHVGGFDDLAALDRQGKLDDLLNG